MTTNRWVPEIRRASRHMLRELGLLENRFAGASAAECHALLEIEQAGRLTSGELAERLNVDKSSASRTAAALLRRRWAKTLKDPTDSRRKPLALSAGGARRLEKINASADAQVGEALEFLAPEEQRAVYEGLALYSHALRARRRSAGFVLRPIEPRDDAAVANIIRTVMPEFGALGPGYAIEDAEVDCMSQSYAAPGAAYYVLEREGRVLGGAGFAALAGGRAGTCELRKMYFSTPARGLGLGALLLSRCLNDAKSAGYTHCYLETLEHMHAARRLYRRFGFQELCAARGATGHTGCDTWYEREL